MVAERRDRRDQPRGAGRADGRPQGAAAARQGAAAVGRGAARRPSISSLVDDRGVRLLDDVDLELRAGEIVGIAGVSGNGQTELLQVLSGIRRADRRHADGAAAATIDAAPSRRSGARCARSASRTCRRTACARAWWRPSRPRRRRSWATSGEPPYSRNYLLDRAGGRRALRRLMERFDVRPRAPGAALVELLRRQPAEAGAGARDGARAASAAGRPADARRRHRRHRVHPSRSWSRARDAGCAVLVVSVELDEILSLADRILVMFAGRIVGEVAGRPRRRAHAGPDDGRRQAAAERDA